MNEEGTAVVLLQNKTVREKQLLSPPIIIHLQESWVMKYVFRGIQMRSNYSLPASLPPGPFIAL